MLLSATATARTSAPPLSAMVERPQNSVVYTECKLTDDVIITATIHRTAAALMFKTPGASRQVMLLSEQGRLGGQIPENGSVQDPTSPPRSILHQPGLQTLTWVDLGHSRAPTSPAQEVCTLNMFHAAVLQAYRRGGSENSSTDTMSTGTCRKSLIQSIGAHLNRENSERYGLCVEALL